MEVLKLNQRCRDQERKLKLRSQQEEKMKALQSDITKMKHDKVEMVRKKREDTKR